MIPIKKAKEFYSTTMHQYALPIPCYSGYLSILKVLSTQSLFR